MRLLQTLVQRTGGNVRLVSLIVIAAILAAAVTPFIVYRAVLGQWAAVLGDTLVLAAVAGPAWYAWRTGRGELAGTTAAFFVAIAGVALGSVIGTTALFWTAPIVIGIHMLAPRWLASLCSAAMVAGQCVMHADGFPDALGMASFAVTSLLVALCAHVAAWLADTQRVRLEVLATRDPLTGVENRRALEAALRDLAAGGSADAGLAVLDLDHFKAINDTHGHEAGDAVLRAFCRVVSAGIRRSDRLFRSGGEEFVLLLPSTPRDGVAQALAKVQEGIHERLSSPSGPVTASIGVAMRAPGESDESWIGRADEAMYEAKRAGRDRIVFAREPPRPERRGHHRD